MGAVWGLVLGAGLFLVWTSWWIPERRAASRVEGWRARTQDRLVQAGAASVTPAALLGTSIGIGAVVFLLTSGMSGSPTIGLCFGVIAGRAPFALVIMRARARREAMRDVWPEVVDNLASGIRAGMSLPDALGQLGDRGPEQVRQAFIMFAQDYRTTGRFGDCLDALKGRLADPVADRIVEALRITREVGGTDVGRLLRTLSEFLREEARIRGELEARQSWTVNAARLAVAAPWVVLAFLSSQPDNAVAYNSAAGVTVLALGGGSTVIAYRLMVRVGRLPVEARVLR
ncbi:MAG: type II secretion system protein F [Actinobacteria bacterium HGW-Actinobacteria-4]|nr:MAG: type II secretion system protein F [Actinobacteria bacterium HGW-Actinobacteria-4]